MTKQQLAERDRRRFEGDEGTALVEFALVLPFMVFIFLGIFEYGTAWRNSTIIASSLRTAVRSVAQSKTSFGADLYALQGLMASLQTTNGITVEKVVIYNGTTNAVSTGATAGQPVAACKNASNRGSAPTGCNVYRGTVELTTANLVASNFATSASSCTSGRYDYRWCPNTRLNSMSTTAGPDWVGIYIVVRYEAVTSLLPNSVTVTDYTSSRIEPPAT